MSKPEEPMRDAMHVARKRVVALVLLFVLLGFGFRAYLQRRDGTLGTDSYQYLLLSRSVASGDGYVSGGGQFPDVSRPPVFPLVVAAVSRVTGNVEFAGSLVMALSGALVVVPMFLLAFALFGERAAWAALPLGALSCMAMASTQIGPTSLYVLLSLTAALVAYRCALRPGVLRCVGVGALASLAALTRGEGVIWPPVLCAWVAFGGPAVARPGRLARAALVLAGAVAVYAPYAAWASARLGRFCPVPEIAYLQDMRLVSDMLGLRSVEGPPLRWTERAQFLLDAGHERFVLDAYFADHVLPDPDPRESAREKRTVADPSRQNVKAVAGRRLFIAKNNLLRLPRILHQAGFLTPLTAALGALGFVATVRRKERWRSIIFVALMAAASLGPAASHLEGRLFFTLFGFALLVCAAGWGALGSWSPLTATPGRAIAWALHGAIGLAILSGAVTCVVGAKTDPVRERVLEETARLHAANLPPGAMLAVNPMVPYLARRSYLAIPLGSPEDVRDFARAHAARSLVFEAGRDLARRPKLEALLADPPPAGFRLIGRRPDPRGGEIRLFAIEE